MNTYIKAPYENSKKIFDVIFMAEFGTNSQYLVLATEIPIQS